jgi:hypothetical protein
MRSDCTASCPLVLAAYGASARLEACEQFQYQPRGERERRPYDKDGERNRQDDQEQRPGVEHEPEHTTRGGSHGGLSHADLGRVTTLAAGVAPSSATSAWSNGPTLLVACALRQLIRHTVAPPTMKTVMKANVGTDRADGTAQSHRAATHEADTLSGASTLRSGELGCVKGHTFRWISTKVN